MPKRANFDPRRMHGNAILMRDMKTPIPANDTPMVGNGLLLDPGLGAAFSSPEEFHQMTGKGVASSMGLGLSDIGQKLKNLKASQFSAKPKNISFTL